MSYTLKITLYIINLISLLISGGAILYSIYGLIVFSDNYSAWLKDLGLSVFAFIILVSLFILRKKKLPVPGIDYK